MPVSQGGLHTATETGQRRSHTATLYCDALSRVETYGALFRATRARPRQMDGCNSVHSHAVLDPAYESVAGSITSAAGLCLAASNRDYCSRREPQRRQQH